VPEVVFRIMAGRLSRNEASCVQHDQQTPETGSVGTDVDVLIVGSGPVGAAYARILSMAFPAASLLMVDRGPMLSELPGTNLKNFLKNGALSGDPAGTGHADAIPVVPAASLARSGTQLIDPRGPRAGHMPAAAVSTNVGGMGAHWSCATPAPADDERVGWLPDEEWQRLLSVAGRLLNSSTSAFAESARGAAIIDALAAELGDRLDRPVQVMPHACQRLPDGRLSWTGTDTVLGPLARGANGGPAPDARFELRPDTLCRRLEVRGGTVTGAEIEHLPTGRREKVTARAVVVACDSLRTPQLLWASGIRPAALGRYLNEHPMVGATVVLTDDAAKRAAQFVGEDAASDFDGDPLAAVWVPYSALGHRFSGQIATSPGSPAGFAVAGLENAPKSRVVSLTWFCPKELSPDDRIEFTEELDEHGMPVPELHYRLTPQDERVVATAIELTARAGAAFGEFVPGEEPKLLADGQSLHYMGTVRIGEADDGTCVCDDYSRVWGFQNLYVGGNGVIPTATACNPTLTSVAFAVRAAEQLAASLGGSSTSAPPSN